MHNINEYFYYLYNLERANKNYTLDNTRLILKHLGNPQDKIKCIHIAGTNGKGGTASFLASILMEHGFKTGLFTSPHILRFNERIKVNGVTISNNYVKSFVDDNLKYFKKIKPSFFEVNTAMALKYFCDKKVDVAVIETGLGGRLDSTNVIIPELSIITQIGMDHTDMLGNTLKKIAREKIGIVKPNIDVILSDTHNELEALFRKSIEKNHLHYLKDLIKIRLIRNSIEACDFEIYSKNFKKLDRKIFSSPLPGIYQAKNTATALLAALLFLKNNDLKLSLSKAKKGIARVKSNTGYRGRFELIRKGNYKYIFDVAHNPDGIKESLTNLNNKKADVIVFGMMNDKDYRTSIKEIMNHTDKIIFTKPKNKRALDTSVLYNYAKRLSPKQRLICRDAVSVAVKTAEGLRRMDGTILFIGSFFLVSEAIQVLGLSRDFYF
jgi:dihydrofolate synthase/folylpolyglutamate synthase